MWCYSSCARLHQKYNVPNVFFIGIKELCTALADNAWLTANPEVKFHKLRLDAISIPDYVIKKGATQVQREYHLATWRFGRYRETCRSRISIIYRNSRKLGNWRQWRRMASQSPYFNKLCAAHIEKVSSIVRQRYGRSPTDQMKDFDVNTGIWWKLCLSLFKLQFILGRLHGKITINQESTFEIFETGTSSDWEVDHGSDRNYSIDHDWLAAAFVERDYSVNWQSC